MHASNLHIIKEIYKNTNCMLIKINFSSGMFKVLTKNPLFTVLPRIERSHW